MNPVVYNIGSRVVGRVTGSARPLGADAAGVIGAIGDDDAKFTVGDDDTVFNVGSDPLGRRAVNDAGAFC